MMVFVARSAGRRQGRSKRHMITATSASGVFLLAAQSPLGSALMLRLSSCLARAFGLTVPQSVLAQADGTRGRCCHACPMAAQGQLRRTVASDRRTRHVPCSRPTTCPVSHSAPRSAIGSTSQPFPTRLLSMAGSCYCAGPTTISSQRRTARSTAPAASATRYRYAPPKLPASVSSRRLPYPCSS